MYITSPGVRDWLINESVFYYGEMANGNFEGALNTMKAGNTEEFLKSSLTVLKIMQNIMVHPDVDKFKKIRLAATVSENYYYYTRLSYWMHKKLVM